MRNIIFFLVTIFLSSGLAAELRPGKPLIYSYAVADYQGHAQNWSIQQGPDGLIYVGGGSSLLVFDGGSWRSIETPDEGRVRSLEIDQEGRLWTAMPSQFGYFERADNGSLAYRSISDLLPEAERDFGETRHVRRTDHATHFNTLHRLFHWDGSELKTFDKWDGLFRLAFAAHGRYYVAVKSRLYDFTELDLSEPPAPEPRWRWKDGARITFLKEWDEGQLLLGTYDDGLYLLGDGEPVRFADQIELVSSWPYDALRLPDRSVIILTINDGIFHYSASGQLIEHLSTNNGLPVAAVIGATIDHQGGLWLAQEGAVSRVELSLPLRYYDQDAQIVNPRALIEHQGHLLVGGNTSLGVLETNTDGNPMVRALDVDPVQESFDLLSLGTSVLIAGFHGIHQVTLNETATAVETIERVYEDTYAYRMFRSPSRPVIYVEAESGFAVLRESGDGYRTLTKVEGLNERPAEIVEDAQGRVWVGSGDGHFYVLSWQDDESLQLTMTLGPEQGVPEGNAHAYRLGDRLVLGTTLGGYRFDEVKQRVEPDPLFGNEQLGDGRDVYRFYSPDNQRIAALIGPQKLLWRGDLQSDGSIQWRGPQYPQLDPGDSSMVEEVVGSLWFGQATRLYKTDWPSDADRSPDGQLQLRSAGFPDRLAGQGELLLHGNYDPTQPRIEALPYSQDGLRFEYALASFARPEKTQYRARLEGYDKDWSKWSAETRRDYTNLSGGEYRFFAQARDVYGNIVESSPYPFSVQPPWYLSRLAWFAYITAALLSLWLAAYLGQRYRRQRMLMVQDQLEREVAERTKEVRQQARELRRVNEAKSRFFANVSHEFRTPLTLAKGPLAELASGEAGPLSKEAERYVGMALRNTETMQGLIGQILDIDRLEAGRMPISVTHDDFLKLVRSVSAEFSRQAMQQGVRLIIDSETAELKADFDPDHMAKVVRNLISNALKFTADGGRIDIRCQIKDEQIELQVADTGCGIDVADQQRIFERYYQGNQTHASHPGTGIGLALVRELVELHQGQVGVASAIGEGSIFPVRFPIALPELANGPIAVATGTANESIDPSQLWRADSDADDVPTILIVDDNAELRAFLNLRLRGSYRVLEAGDGEQGLAKAQSELPDVIVTDVMMPRMTGLEMTAALKGDATTDFMPILMLSARTTRRDTVEGLEHGADDYLAKPFDSAELATRVAGLIASRRKLQQRSQEKSQAIEAWSLFLQKAHEIVLEHLGDPEFGPRDWANLLHMDRTTLYRKLKAETKHSPEEYLREQRLQTAAKLLKSKAGNVSQVAVAVGFNSISYFSKRFKARFDVTPAAYAERD